jgi:uncharacterized protein YdeI (YjbR/CyaY-like superfamily)
MKLTPSAHCATREEWRNWLQKHHASHSEVWLHYFKKHTGKKTVTYLESLEEALCFGWIDGLKRRVDDERYAHRFTPRKAKSKWSPQNIRLAQQLVDEGKMTEAGLAAFKNRIAYDDEFLEKRRQAELPEPREFTEALEENSRARQNLQAMAPGYRKQYIAWISAAKRSETRSKRVAETIRMLEQNKKPGMK